jgi:hypothetical protein
MSSNSPPQQKSGRNQNDERWNARMTAFALKSLRHDYTLTKLADSNLDDELL